MNKTFLIGNLTKDPELTETASGVQLCRFSLAVNRSYTGSDGERKTDFFDCVAWRGLAETVAKYVRKGNKVALLGSLEMNSYEDGKGVKRTSYTVVVGDIEFLTAKTSAEDDAASKHLQPINVDNDIPF